MCISLLGNSVALPLIVLLREIVTPKYLHSLLMGWCIIKVWAFERIESQETVKSSFLSFHFCGSLSSLRGWSWSSCVSLELGIFMGIVISENYFETNNLALLNFQEYTIPIRIPALWTHLRTTFLLDFFNYLIFHIDTK